MFRPATNKNLFEIQFSNFTIPANATAEDIFTLEKLASLMQLISQKYGTKYGVGRFDKQSPNDISLVFPNSGFVKAENAYEQIGLRETLYLQSFGEVTKENKTSYSYLSSTVITINKDKIDDVIEGLNLLATMSEEEAENRNRSVVSMAC